MTQLPLDIIPRVRYAPEGFVAHSGAAAVSADLKNDLEAQDFRIRFVQGELRSGKTHFLIWAAAEGAARGITAVEIEAFDGLDLGQHLESISPGSLILIDDADKFLMKVLPGASGTFVSFVERARLLRCKLILMSSAAADSFPCDEHVMSRLKPGLGAALGAPASEELPLILTQIARQHGVELGERVAQSVSLRVDRSIGGLEKFVLESSSKALSAGSFHRALRGRG